MKPLEIRPLTPDDLDDLIAIRRVAFLDDTDYKEPVHRSRMAKRLETVSGAYLGEELTAAGGMLPFGMYVAGESVAVGGLAGVVSAAEHRRKGHVRALLASLLDDLRAASVGWSLEYPFDPRYYAKFGWQTIPNGVHVEAPPGKLAMAGHRSTCRRVDPDDADVRARLADIYGRWARRFNFTMTRDGTARDDWRMILKGSPWRPPPKSRFVYLFDQAYCVLELRRESQRGTVAYVADSAWTSRAGQEALRGFLGNLRGQVDLVHWQLPVHDPVVLDLTGYLVAQPHPLQARIVDVRVALADVPLRRDIDVVFEVTDDFCPWNAGAFRVGRRDGRSTVEESVDAPAFSIDITELALCCADRPAAEYADRGELAALAGRPSFMSLADYF